MYDMSVVCSCCCASQQQAAPYYFSPYTHKLPPILSTLYSSFPPTHPSPPIPLSASFSNEKGRHFSLLHFFIFLFCFCQLAHRPHQYSNPPPISHPLLHNLCAFAECFLFPTRRQPLLLVLLKVRTNL